MKRCLTFFALVIAFFVLLSTNVLAADIVASGGHTTGWEWALDGDGVLTISGYGTMPNCSATSSPWYSYRDQIKTVDIYSDGSGISIGDYAFYNLRNLQEVELHGSGVSGIGAHAFEHCVNLKEAHLWSWNVDFPIKERAFYGCSSLEEISLSGDCSIGANAFGQCKNLREIYISSTGMSQDTINTIYFGADETAFSGVVANIYYPKGLKNYIATSGFGGTLTWNGVPYGVCGSDAKWSFDENTGELKIFGTGDIQSLWGGVCQPWWYCFQDKIKGIIIEDGITEIPEYCFEALENVTSCVLPNTLYSVHPKVFNRCAALNTVTFTGNAPAFDKLTFNTVTATVYYPMDNATWTAEVMQDYGGTLTWESYDTSPMTITDTGRSISLQDQIYINQYVTVSSFDDIDVEAKGGLLIWNSPVTEEEALYGTADTTQEGLIAYGDEYTQRTLGISAKNYADELYLRVYVEVADGEYVYGPLVEYSVQDYCEHKIATDGYSAELKQTCAALLHYGTMAQRYFNYNTADLANANILDIYPAPAWMTED